MREVEAQTICGHITTLLLHVLAEYLTQCVVNNVGSRVVASNSLTTIGIHSSYQCTLNILWQFSTKVHCQVILLLGIQHAHIAQCTGVTNLTTHLCIEWSFREHYLVEVFAFLVYLAITKYLGFAAQNIISHKLGIAF